MTLNQGRRGEEVPQSSPFGKAAIKRADDRDKATRDKATRDTATRDKATKDTAIGRRGVCTAAIQLFDRWLRRRQGVFSFTDEPGVLVRISFERLAYPLVFADGERFEPGERIIELHLWNEHFLQPGRDTASLSWAAGMRDRFIRSWESLAAYLRDEPAVADIRVVRGGTMFPARMNPARLDAVMTRFGFDMIPEPPPGLWQSFYRRLADPLFWALAWAFNPGSPGGPALRHRYRGYWIRRETLIDLYGAARPAETSAPEKTPENATEAEL